MVEYMTIETTDTDNLERLHRYPHMSCEVFCLDVKPILDVFIGKDGSPSMLPLLFKILENDSALSPRLAGYFNKVIL